MKWCISALFLASAAVAYPQHEGEIYGTVGRATIWDDEGSLGSGLSAGGILGWRLTPRLALELNADYFSHRREFSFATVRGHGATITGDLLYHFSRSRAQPYVFGGIGLVHYVNESGFSPGPERNATGRLLVFGFGIKGFVTERIAIRPEWRAGYGTGTSAAIEPPLLYQRIGIGLGYRW